MNLNPLVVEVIRGSEVESRHQVLAAIYSHRPSQQIVFGDPEFRVFPRSSTKPLQALPILLTGAAQAFEITDEELALASASHLGEPLHLERLIPWMNRLGLKASDLECGSHPPFQQQAHENLLKTGREITPLHNNCSGKHLGMLATARHRGEDTKNYVTQNHPVQQRVLKITEKLTHFSLGSAPLGIDGCSIPAPAFPLKNLALAFCEFGKPTRLSDEEAHASKRLFKAFVEHPILTSGSDHYCAQIMKAVTKPTLVKMGAEGIIGGCVPELEIGFMIKSLDGAHRGSELVLSHFLKAWGILSPENTFLSPTLKNWEGLTTGFLRLEKPLSL